MVEMISSEKRDVRNAEFMSVWEKKSLHGPHISILYNVVVDLE